MLKHKVNPSLWNSSALKTEAFVCVSLPQCNRAQVCQAAAAATYVLLAHDVIEGQLRAPRRLVEGGAAGPAVG